MYISKKKKLKTTDFFFIVTGTTRQILERLNEAQKNVIYSGLILYENVF